MRSIDTNILLRFFRDDDATQSPIARRVMKDGPLFVAKTVLLEFAWAMKYRYEHTQEDIAECLSVIANLENVTLEDPETVRAALRSFDKGLEIADALHLASSRHCAEFLTFDDKRFTRRANRLGIKPPCSIPE